MNREPYLKDRKFLKELDNEHIKTLTARITILSWDERPLADFTGKVLPGGTVNLDGNSSMRRTCNLTLALDDNEINITNIENLISINKKATVEIGIHNTLNEYNEYEIIWFPLGVYIMIQPTLSRSTSGTTLSLQLKDKMCLLNGEVGGILPASVTFSEMGYTDNDGNEFIEHPTIFQIIFELVNHFGGEQLGNIIISDLDTRIRKIVKWNSSNYPLYWKESSGVYTDEETHETQDYRTYQYLSQSQFDLQQNQNDWNTYEYGEDVGYVYTDFIWPGEDLIGDVGESICSILDKIIGILGNYEYFYDIYGKFHFQEKKNYLNTTQATTFVKQLERNANSKKYTLMTQNDYQIDLTNGKAEYVFDNNNLITSYTNTPQFNQIKNDFLIWGLRKNVDDTTLPIRYHLAIDKKPEIGEPHLVVLYKDQDGIMKAASVEERDKKTGNYKLGHFYCDSKTSKVMFIDEDIQKFAYAQNGIVYVSLLGIDATLFKYDFLEEDGIKTKTKGFIQIEQKVGEIYLAIIIPNDWRTELYLQGVKAEATGTDSNYYYTELVNEWPKIFDLENNRFKEEVLADPSSIDYYLDFIDSNSAVGEFSINNIGRRTLALVDDKVNCVFPSVLRTECAIVTDNSEVREVIKRGDYAYSNVSEDVYKNLIQGGSQNSAFEKIREMLYQYTSYCENITFQAIPIYHLDVNTRVTVQDIKSNIFGDYFINRITLPLDCTGMMTVNATRALDRERVMIKAPEQIIEKESVFDEIRAKIDSIRILVLPNKLSYQEDEPIDITGILVHGYDIDGNDLGAIPESIIGHTIYAKTINGRSDVTISVNLNNKLMTDSYEISINENLIPLMTSNYQPIGEVKYNEVQGCTGAGTNAVAAGVENSYYAFDRNNTTGVTYMSENVYGIIEYDFPVPVTIEEIGFNAGVGAMNGYYKDFDFKVSLYYNEDWHTYGTKNIHNGVMLPAPLNEYSIDGSDDISGVTKIKIASETQKTYGNGWVINNIKAFGHTDFVFNGGYIIKDGYLTHYPCHTGDYSGAYSKYLLDSRYRGYGSMWKAEMGGTYEDFSNVRIVPTTGNNGGVTLAVGSLGTWNDNSRLQTSCFFLDVPFNITDNEVRLDFSVEGHHPANYSSSYGTGDIIKLLVIQHPEKMAAGKSISSDATELGVVSYDIYNHTARSNYTEDNISVTQEINGPYNNCLLGIMIIKSHNGDYVTSEGGSYCKMTIQNWEVRNKTLPNRFANASYIEVTTLPNTLNYQKNDNIDITGLSVHAYDENDNDLGEVPLEYLEYTKKAKVHTGITAKSNSLVSTGDTLLSSWNGSRSPVKKDNSIPSACMLGKNTASDAWGGNWCAVWSISDSSEGASITMADQGSINPEKRTLSNIDYYIEFNHSNASWGGATPETITNPLGLPVLENKQLHQTNQGSTDAQVKYVIRYLEVLWDGGAVTLSAIAPSGKVMKTQYGIGVSPFSANVSVNTHDYVPPQNLSVNVATNVHDYVPPRNFTVNISANIKDS